MILVIGACFVSRTFSHRSVGYYSRCPQLWSEAAEEAAAPLQQDAGFASGGTNQLDTDGWRVCQDRTNILVISDRERERTPDSSRPRRFIGRRNSSLSCAGCGPSDDIQAVLGSKAWLKGNFTVNNYHGFLMFAVFVFQSKYCLHCSWPRAWGPWLSHGWNPRMNLFAGPSSPSKPAWWASTVCMFIPEAGTMTHIIPHFLGIPYYN